MKRASHSDSGLTLVELLIASAISVIVLVMVLSLYSTVTKNVEVSDLDRRRDEAAMTVMGELRRDLRGAYRPATTNDVLFRLEQGDTGALNLIFHTVEIPEGTLDPEEYIERRVEWSFDPERKITGGQVTRHASDPEGRVPPDERRLGESIQLLAMSAFDGQEWQSVWPLEGKAMLPLLIRIDLEYESARVGRSRHRWSETLIPAAKTFRPPSPDPDDEAAS